MNRKLAIVFCVHHKPWLIMGSLLTWASQAPEEADLFFAFNLGDGASRRASYEDYRKLAATLGVNPQLSPFDERVRQACRVRGPRTFEIDYENDHALDSGTWYKFIRDGRWREYDYVLFVGEGMLLAHPRLLRALVAFADRRGVHFVASGHEKRRFPRTVMDDYCTRGDAATPMDRFHDRMIAEAFGVFRRDPGFQSVYDGWGGAAPVQTEHNVPGVTPSGEFGRRVRSRIQKQWSSAYVNPGAAAIGRALRAVPGAVDRWSSRVRLMLPSTAVRTEAGPPLAFDAGGYGTHPPFDATAIDTEQGVTFHRVDGPEWFGCATNHLLSRRFLERLTERLDRFGMYEVLDLPFAGTALEVIWGMLPAWLGYEKWFTNGFHRVRKHFAMYQREDYPPEMASYINRYHRGRLAVNWRGDLLTLDAWRRRELGDLRQVLPAMYF